MRRTTTALAVTVGLVASLGVSSAPAPSETSAERGHDATLRAGSVDVPVTPDEGGHWVDGADPGHHGEFVPRGSRWRHAALTYGFVNHTPDLSHSAQEQAIAAAMDTWASYSRLTFTKVADCNLPFDHADCDEPDIRIAFAAGNHGDGPGIAPFDGPGGTAAHGFYPPPNGRSAAGDLHFDEAERWSTNGTGVDLQSVAVHELGHALGLDHALPLQCPPRTNANRPTMCPSIIGVDRTLAPDDIAGIRHLYGRPAQACAGRAITVDLGQGERPTNGPDVILGTPGPDKINAGRGADIVCSGGGDDVIDLGPGNDRAIAGRGNDRIYGRSGADRIDGGAGRDRVWAGSGPDRVYGGPGTDVLDGGTAADELYGGAHRDDCNGRGGRDLSRSCERHRSIESLLR